MATRSVSQSTTRAVPVALALASVVAVRGVTVRAVDAHTGDLSTRYYAAWTIPMAMMMKSVPRPTGPPR
jgi:hypothetical protein